MPGVPTRKVSFSAISGSIVVIIVWLVKVFLKFEVPGEIVAAFTSIVGFIVGYFTKNHPQDRSK